MDRLLCGDVGYGKTEVALRAVMKCMLGRQAGGHPRAHHRSGPAALRTALNRFRSSPCASRCCPASARPAQIKEIAARVKTTARSTSSSARTGCCKRCGVQGSGPAHHRRGAALRRHAQGKAQGTRRRCDILTLSATPIPGR